MAVGLSALGGCVGGADSLSDEPTLDVSDGVGVILGVVLSEELFPVVGGTVSVADGPSVQTNDAGRFELTDVLAGLRTLNVSADGYESKTHEVEVVAGGVHEVRLSLKGLPGESPYMLTIPYEGYSICSFSAVYSAGWPVAGCALGERKTLLKVEVAAGWAGGVHEMVWPSNEEMIFASHVRTVERPDAGPGCQTSGSTHDWCPAMVWGKSPLRIVARPEDAAYAKKYAIDGKEMWPQGNYTSHVFTSYSGYLRGEINGTAYPACVIVNRQFNVPEHWGCPFGVGVALGIRFQFYHTTFYLLAPLNLDAFSARPDK